MFSYGGLERLRSSSEHHARLGWRIDLATGDAHDRESMVSLDAALAVDFLVHLAISH